MRLGCDDVLRASRAQDKRFLLRQNFFIFFERFFTFQRIAKERLQGVPGFSIKPSTKKTQHSHIMSDTNRISVTITDQTVTDILGHLTAIEQLLPFLITREEGDNAVMLGQKSVGFDEKCAGYMQTNPEFIPGYVAIAEVLKDRTAREQFLKFLPSLKLVTAKAEDTFDVLGNEIMLANLAYYNNTDAAAKHGTPGAANIHDDLAIRYPGRPSKAAAAKTAQVAAK